MSINSIDFDEIDLLLCRYQKIVLLKSCKFLETNSSYSLYVDTLLAKLEEELCSVLDIMIDTEIDNNDLGISHLCLPWYRDTK